MKLIFIPQVLVAILLIITILLQAKGTGLGSAWSGSGEFYRSKRGAEKLIFTATIVLSGLFILLSLLSAII